MRLSPIPSTANFTLNKDVAVRNKCCGADSDALILEQQRPGSRALRSASKTAVGVSACASCAHDDVTCGFYQDLTYC